jgi:uncharacterized protein (TIGR03086 family)
MTGGDPFSLYARACAGFDDLVRSIDETGWSAATPCPEWDVRALINHVTVEDLWAGELFAGRTIEQVGSAFDGDQLGDSPAARWSRAMSGALAAAGAPDTMTRTVHLSFGDVPGAEYAMQLFADHLVHAWDLATALGRDGRLDPELVAACREWFAANEEAYRATGAIGPRQPLPADADEQATLLAAFGRAS